MSPMPLLDFVGMDTELGTCGTCRISLNANTNSQLLPCLHSMCSNCMPSPSSETAVCPVCGMLYSHKSVTPNSMFSHASSMSSHKCGGCESAAVEGWCVECEEMLCEECVSAHKRVRLTRDHTIKTQISSSGFAKKRYCPIHKDEPYKLYCLTCGQLTCRDCQLTLHMNHNYRFVGEVVLECRQNLETLVQRVKEQRAFTQRSLQDLEGRLLDIEDVMEGFKEDVKRALKDIRDMLVKTAMKLISDAKVLCTAEMDRLKQKQVVLQKLLERQAYLLAFSQKTLESMDQCVLLSCVNRVQQQLQIVLTQNPPALVNMIQITPHLNPQAIQEALCRFGMVTWRAVPFACSKKHRSPKTVKETPLASVSAQALSQDSPDPLRLLEPKGITTEVPPTATRGGSVSSPMKVSAESTTPSPGCAEGNPALNSVVGMECEPSSTVLDPVVDKPSSTSENAPPPSPPPVIDLTDETPSSWHKPGGTVAPGVSTAAPSGSSLTHVASTRGSFINLDKDSDASNGGSVEVKSSQEGQVKDYGVGTLSSATDRAAPNDGNVVRRMEIGSPAGLGIHPSHVQTDTNKTQGMRSKSPAKLSIHGAKSECLVTENVPGMESCHSETINAQGAETEGTLGFGESGCLTSEHVQKVQEMKPDCQDTELDQEAESEDQQAQCVQDIISDCAATEHVQEEVSHCNPTEHVQEEVSDCNSIEHVQEEVSDCNTTTKHVQEVISDCNTTKQKLVSNCASTEHVLETPNESKCVPTELMQETVSHCVSTEHVQETVSDCATTERVQETVSHCATTEHVQETVSHCVTTEHVQDVEPTCVSSEHGQEVELTCVSSEHVQEVEPTCVSSEHVQEVEPTCVSSEHVQVVTDCTITEHEQIDVSAHPEADLSSVAPSGPSLQTSSPQTPCQEYPTLPSFLRALNLTAAQSPELIRESTLSSDSQGTETVEHQSEAVNSYCCPLEDDDLDEDDDCIDVELQDKEIYQLLPKKHWLPQVSVYQLSLPSVPPGQPLPQFHLLQGESSMEFLIQEVTGDNESPIRRQSPGRVAVPARQKHCAVCRVVGMLDHCVTCRRGFHKGCHIPPLITKLREDWVCGLCLDVSAEVRLQDDFEGGSCMSPQDQKRCECLMLSLWCSKYRPALFMQNQEPASSTSTAMSIILIRGRLLQKLPPPYRTPAEFVSDIWLLLDILLKKAKWKTECERQLRALQMTFARHLQRTFGQTLHPSLLRNPYGRRRRGPPRKPLQPQQPQPPPHERPANRGEESKSGSGAGGTSRRGRKRKQIAGTEEKEKKRTRTEFQSQTQTPAGSQTQMPLESQTLLQSQLASQTETDTQTQTQSQMQLQSLTPLQSQTDTQPLRLQTRLQSHTNLRSPRLC